MLRHHGEKFWNSDDRRMWETDESGRAICSLSFSAEHNIFSEQQQDNR
jgi:hypothetical protein